MSNSISVGDKIRVVEEGLSKLNFGRVYTVSRVENVTANNNENETCYEIDFDGESEDLKCWYYPDPILFEKVDGI